MFCSRTTNCGWFKSINTVKHTAYFLPFKCRYVLEVAFKLRPQTNFWQFCFQLGQPCRMLLHYTDTEYEDTVWEVTKREFWMQAKAKNDFDLDFPNLPYWVDGNIKLTQSTAIMRHLARKNGLYGLTDSHASEIDMLIDTSMDLKMSMIKLVLGDFVSLNVLKVRQENVHFVLF